MKITGRLFVMSAVLSFHTAYIIYYYFRDGRVDIADILGYPLFAILSYWAGYQYDKAEYFSQKDTLTNLYNRRFISSTFAKAAALADRSGAQLHVLVIDCNSFKQINDRYDHSTGDAVLIAISALLLRVTRKSDIAVRWGGDEFLVIGQYKDAEGLQTLMNRLSEECRGLSRQFGFPISVSIGASLYPQDHTHLHDLIKIADRRMYSTKQVAREEAPGGTEK